MVDIKKIMDKIEWMILSVEKHCQEIKNNGEEPNFDLVHQIAKFQCLKDWIERLEA